MFKHTIFPRIVSAKTVLFRIFKPLKSHIVSALHSFLCNEKLNSFLTRVLKLFKGGNFSREETICGIMVPTWKFLGMLGKVPTWLSVIIPILISRFGEIFHGFNDTVQQHISWSTIFFNGPRIRLVEFEKLGTLISMQISRT